jgi:hypothetical protein
LIFLSGNAWVAVTLLSLSLIGGIFAIRNGNIGREKVRKLKGLAIAGRILGILAVVYSLLLFILLIAYRSFDIIEIPPFTLSYSKPQFRLILLRYQPFLIYYGL